MKNFSKDFKEPPIEWKPFLGVQLLTGVDNWNFTYLCHPYCKILYSIHSPQPWWPPKGTFFFSSSEKQKESSYVPMVAPIASMVACLSLLSNFAYFDINNPESESLLSVLLSMSLIIYWCHMAVQHLDDASNF